MLPGEYVSSLCRCQRHADCERNPVVTCACPCHWGLLREPTGPYEMLEAEQRRARRRRRPRLGFKRPRRASGL